MVHKTWNKRISTAKLNRWLDHTQGHHPPPAVSGRRLKLKYMTQIKSRPPGFMISCTRPEAVPESYTRYLINSLRADFDMPGIPLRVVYRKRRQSLCAQGRQDQAGFGDAEEISAAHGVGEARPEEAQQLK